MIKNNLKSSYNSKHIATSLTTAALTLLQAPCSQAAEATGFQSDAGVLFYTESDGIQLVKPAIRMSRSMGGDDRLNMLMSTDIMTGATPTGAVKQQSQSAQTFTSPTGRNYEIGAGERPEEDRFRDIRASFRANYSKALDSNNSLLINGYVSAELDYFVLGFGGGILHYFNNKNTSFNFEVNTYSEQIRAQGDIPVAFTPMLSDRQNASDSGDRKTVFDYDIGFSQVLTRKSIMKFNLNFNDSTGYLTNPYKVLSVLDSNGNITDAGLVNLDPNALPYVFEARPDDRLRKSAFVSLVQKFSQDVLHLSYRYYWDDWDVSSNTYDIRYRYKMDDKQYLLPHIRYYQQNAAEFYRPSLRQGVDVDAGGNVLLDAASADYRLSDFDGLVLGFGYGAQVTSQDEFVIRVEYLTEVFDTQSSVRADQQLDDFSALSIQVRYSSNW